MHDAAAAGHKEVAELLIAEGADVNAKDSTFGRTLLHIAAREGHKEIVELLLAKGVDVNAKDKEGKTPLDAAIYGKNPQTADLLRKHGGKSGAEISIQAAVAVGNIEAVKQHLAAGSDVNAKNSDDWTPLQIAADKGHKEIAELLIDKGADVNAKNDRGGTPLHYAASGVSPSSSAQSGGGHKEVAELLIANGADVSAKNDRGGTPLHRAALKGRKEIASLLLDAGADVNAKRNGDKTPLDDVAYFRPRARRGDAESSRNGRKEITDLLRKHGAKTAKELKHGGKTNKELRNEDALTSACLSGNMMTIKKLIKDGAHINSKGRTGVTPLNIAVYSGNRKVVKFLLDNGADVNFEDKEGYAPLHNVMLKEDAELLIKNGADMRAKTNKGQTPLHTAAILRHLEIIELLVSSGVEVNAIDKSGQTPLDYAKMWDTASAEEKEIANTLLRDNDDSNSKINKTADLLRKHGGKTGEELKAEGK